MAIKLRDEMFPEVLSGKKTATLRKGIRNYHLGIAALYGKDNFAFIAITKITYTKLQHITDQDAQTEGYNSRKELVDVMKNIYPDITESSEVTQVHFGDVFPLESVLTGSGRRSAHTDPATIY